MRQSIPRASATMSRLTKARLLSLSYLFLTVFCLQTVTLLGSSLDVASTPTTALNGCFDGQLACLDGSGCYLEADRCDNIPHCSDKSDEKDCQKTCEENEFHCVVDDDCFSIKYKCDGVPDCPDNSDEESCENVVCSEESEFLCVADKHCIMGSHRCDGKEHCSDGSDEKDCDVPESDHCDAEHSFDCYGDGTLCIPLHKRCDGHRDCRDGGDEVLDLCSSNSSGESDCADRNGGCSHQCIVNPHGYHCECPEGYDLGDDHKTCEDVDECEHHACSHECSNLVGSFECLCYSGYRLSDDQYTCLADGEEPELWATNGSLLFQYHLHSGERKFTNLGRSIVSLDYDHKNGRMFWIDSLQRVIYWTSANVTAPPEVLINSLIDSPAALAYDWVHDNLYWADGGHSPKHSKIEIVTFPKLWRAVVVSSPHVDNPKVLAVDPRPEQGYLYWAAGGARPGIHRAGLDGSDPVTLASTDVNIVHGLTIDLIEDRLFWIDSKLKIIVSLSLHDSHGQQREVLATFSESPNQPIGLAVFEDSVYWADYETKSVYKMYKYLREGEDKPSISPVFDDLTTPHTVVVYHKLKQPEEDRYCGNNNGGCSHICLPSPHFIQFRCECPISLDKTKHFIMNLENTSCHLVATAHSSDPVTVSTSPSVRSNTNFIHIKSMLPTDHEELLVSSSTPLPDGSDATAQNHSDSNDQMVDGAHEEKQDNLWIYIGVGGAVGLAVIFLLSLIGYKLYARHVARNLHFDNPVFEQKPLRNGDGHADSRA